MTTIAHDWFGQQEPDSIREPLRKVFEVEREGERWVFATNGVVLVAEQSDDAAAEGWEHESIPTGSLRGIIFGGPHEIGLGEYATADLRAFAGEPASVAAPKQCSSCRGRGVVDHWCDCDYCDTPEEECEDCDGEGVAVSEREMRHGYIGDAELDRDRLHSALSVLPAERVRLSLNPVGDDTYRVMIEAYPYRVVVQGLISLDEDQPQDAPRFPLHEEVPA